MNDTTKILSVRNPVLLTIAMSRLQQTTLETFQSEGLWQVYVPCLEVFPPFQNGDLHVRAVLKECPLFTLPCLNTGTKHLWWITARLSSPSCCWHILHTHSPHSQLFVPFFLYLHALTGTHKHIYTLSLSLTSVRVSPSSRKHAKSIHFGRKGTFRCYEKVCRRVVKTEELIALFRELIDNGRKCACFYAQVARGGLFCCRVTHNCSVRIYPFAYCTSRWSRFCLLVFVSSNLKLTKC